MYQVTVELHLSEPVGMQVVHVIGVCRFSLLFIRFFVYIIEMNIGTNIDVGELSFIESDNKIKNRPARCIFRCIVRYFIGTLARRNWFVRIESKRI